jgi:hypothetical protein
MHQAGISQAICDRAGQIQYLPAKKILLLRSHRGAELCWLSIIPDEDTDDVI